MPILLNRSLLLHDQLPGWFTCSCLTYSVTVGKYWHTLLICRLTVTLTEPQELCASDDMGNYHEYVLKGCIHGKFEVLYKHTLNRRSEENQSNYKIIHENVLPVGMEHLTAKYTGQIKEECQAVWE